MDLKYWGKRKWENLIIWIAWRLPKTLVRWCLVRAAVKYAGDDKHPGEATYEQMYKAI
jgi:hypothetical protein